MNVTEEDLRTYIDLFHKTLNDSAAKYLPGEVRKNLLHLSLTPARITGYVSTQFGVAIEYEPAAATHIETHRGSARVEELMVQAPPSLRRSNRVVVAVHGNNQIIGCVLTGGFPFRLMRKEAKLTIADTGFEDGTWKRKIHFAEVFGDRSRELWLPDIAVSRAKDEVLVALVDTQRAHEKNITISKYINSFKDKTVLVLGDYDASGLTRLNAISHALKQMGYVPILIKDIPDHPHQDLRQKVVAIGAISRFIVVDDSSKSGHLIEVQLCDQNKWITVVLRAEGKGGTWMTAGISHLSSVILEQPYDPASPETSLAEATHWAEQKLKELQVKFDSTYPWRHGSS